MSTVLICTPCDTPAASIQIVPSGLSLPMAASIFRAPDDLSSKFFAPAPSLFTPPRSILPLALVVTIATSPVNIAARANAMSPPEVISPARLLLPAPDWVNAPLALMSPVADVVNVPAFATVTAPPAVTAADTVSALPVKETAPAAPTAALIAKLPPVKPSAPVRVVAPPMVVVPVPACCVKLAALNAALMPTSLAETTMTAPSAPLVAAYAAPPTMPPKVTSPEPAVIVRVAGAAGVAVASVSDEFSVLVKPALEFVVIRAVFAPSVTALPKVCAPTVVTVPAFRSVVPMPFTVSEAKASPATPVPIAPPKVAVPLPVTVKAFAVPLLFTVRVRVMSVPVRTTLLVRTMASL